MILNRIFGVELTKSENIFTNLEGKTEKFKTVVKTWAKIKHV